MRFSTRPCLFSTCACKRSGDTGSGSGGKSRRNLAGACLEVEPRGDVSLQAQLIAFDREEVVPFTLDYLRTQVTLAEHGIAKDDMALDRQNAEQFESGLVFVGLGIHPYLPEDSPLLMGKSGHQVVARRVAIVAATQVLAVERDRLLGVARHRHGHARGDPAGQGRLESDHIEGSEEIGKARGGGGLAATKAQRVRQGEAMIATELGNGRGSFATVEHGQHGEREHREKGMPPTMATAGVGQVRQRFQQGKRSHPGNLPT